MPSLASLAMPSDTFACGPDLPTLRTDAEISVTTKPRGPRENHPPERQLREPAPGSWAPGPSGHRRETRAGKGSENAQAAQGEVEGGCGGLAPLLGTWALGLHACC